MNFWYVDRPDGPSNPTRKHWFDDCPSIVGIASPTAKSSKEVQRFIGRLPLCKACERRLWKKV